jgi:adenylate cyclase
MVVRIVAVEVQLGDSPQCWRTRCARRSPVAGPRVLTSSRMLSGDTKVGLWSAMLPHAPLRRVLIVTLSGALLVGLLTYVEYGVFVRGALVGGAIGAILSSLEIFVLRRNAGTFFRRLPFLPYLGLRVSLYASVVALVSAVMNWLVTPDGLVIIMSRADIVFTVVFCICTILLFGINDLLGPGVLFAFVAGRYYHPRLEERALLFIDMRSSTAIAESLGEVRFLAFLNRFVTDLSLSILEGGGEIHKYVGDEVISSWKLAAGANEARCVRACFSALDRLAEGGPAYERDFGFRADFRAGLHCGPVVVGELGFVKKEIALIGDAMNTTQRIQGACREANCRVLVSAALLDRLVALPVGVKARALGPIPMRGKEQSVALYALEAVAPT